MNEAKHTEIQRWLIKSQHDLGSAYRLMEGDEPYTVEPAFEHWREVAEELTPYAVQFRYPAAVLEPEKSEAKCALQHAQVFVDFILRLLSSVPKSIENVENRSQLPPLKSRGLGET